MFFSFTKEEEQEMGNTLEYSQASSVLLTVSQSRENGKLLFFLLSFSIVLIDVLLKEKILVLNEALNLWWPF